MSRILRVSAALLLCAVSLVGQAAVIKGGQTILPRHSNGRYDLQYPDGNDSSPLQWGQIANIQIYVGDSCAFNLRTLGSLSGTNAATATLAKVSGTLPTGCTEGTDGITGTATATSMGQLFVWQATDGTSSVTNSFGLTVLALPAGDTTAPTVPTKCSGTGGTGEVTITCDPSSDPYVGEAGRGVSAYKIYLGGSLVATKTAPSANAQPVLTQYLVGGTDGTVTNTQSGADRLLGFGGTGLASASDQFLGVGHTVNGNFSASTTITSYTSGVTTHHGGLIVYADPAVNSSAFFACRVRGSDSKPQARYRSTAGGSAANGTLGSAVSLPYRVRIEQTASGYQCLTSPDGNTWVATEAPRLLSLGALPHVMAYCTSGTAGQTAQCDLDQIHITTSAPWSQSVTTDVGGSWQVEAWDAVTPTANKSAKGAAFTATPSEPAGGGGDCTGDPAPQLVHYDDFDSSPSSTALWVSGTSYAINTVRKSTVDGYDYYCEPAAGCSGATDPANSTSWVPTVDEARWTVNNCRGTATGGFDSYAPSQDSCPAPSTLRARSGARSLRTQLTYHAGATGVASAWVSGTTYSIGDERMAPDANANGQYNTGDWGRYRRKTNGAGTTPPQSDATNWEPVAWYYKNDGSAGDHAHRTELSIRDWSATGFTQSSLNLGDEQWYGFSIFIPASGDANGDPAMDLAAQHSYITPWQLHDIPDRYPATGSDTAQAGSTTTSVKLSSSASNVDGYYVGTVTVSGYARPITGYIGSTRTVLMVPPDWLSGTTYALNVIRRSPANGAAYRRIVAGAGTTDPSADATNWTIMPTSSGPVTIAEPSRNPPLQTNLYGVPGGQTCAPNRDDPATCIDPTYWAMFNWSQDAKFAAKGDSDFGQSASIGSALGQWKTAGMGVWTDFVVRYKPNYTSAGILQVWKNGVEIDVNGSAAGNAYFGPNHPNDDFASYLKIGLYTAQIPPSVVPYDWPKRVVVYLDSHKLATTTSNPTTAVGTDNCAYQKVAPSGTSH